ncbi:transposase, IS204/IS1001/IS1096/IS1165 family protein [Sulfobacillus acidophilus TPY]|nr:transposase, IS204/IS1001/IS1096/IS1165 family protein [Sulfobacillus acidophilus TPY]
MYRWLVARHGTRRRPSPSRRPAPWRPRRWAMACLRRWTTLPRATTERLSMRLQDPEVRRVWTLVHQFRALVTHHRERALAAWLCRAETSGIPELARFARGLRADEAAVRAAIREPWNQGRTEGLNYRIKRLMRLMYGRASFALLRSRLLLTAGQ